MMDAFTRSIVLVCLITLSHAQCPQGAGCSECQYMSGKYEIYCAVSDTNYGFTVTFKPHEYVKITCHISAKWSDFHLGMVQQIVGVKSLSFRSCSLPKSSQLGAIARQLIMNDVDELEFRSTQLNTPLTLTRECFNEFKSIKRLSLSENFLTNITYDLLSDLTKLKVLNLRMNSLKTLPKNFFTSSSLEAIELGMNKLRSIDRTVFGKLEQLKLLNLWNNELKEIGPGTFDDLASLTSIDIHSNYLQTLPTDLFAYSENLRVLDLSRNNFSTALLPQYLLLNNTNLEIFKFFENQQSITTLPSLFFANLSKLISIDISRNKFMYLQKDLFLGVTGLRNLDLHQNALKTLPKEIFKDCKNLSSIILSSNNITHLPDGIFKNLQKLEELNLSNNFIVTISEFIFSDLSFLKVLNMERNVLRVIHPQSLLAVQNLRVAKFSYNQLSLVEAEIYQDEFGKRSPFHYTTDSLEELHLANNNISEIFVDWILATHLQQLDLSFNHLKKIMERDFQFVSGNLSVDLRHNEIQRILFDNDETILWRKDYSKKIIIQLDNNPLVCDCEIYPFLRFLESNKDSSIENMFYFKLDKLLCHEPIWLEKIPVMTLQSKLLKCLVNRPQTLNATCPEQCECWMRPEKRAYLIDCSNKHLIEAPKFIKAPHDHSIEINLTRNYLKQMPLLDQNGYNKVTVLLLGYNNISHISSQFLSKHLRVLNLDNNNLTTVDPLVLSYFQKSMNLVNLTLHGNFWNCDCKDRDFFKFIQTTGARMQELQRVTCEKMNKPMYVMTSDEICPTAISWIVSSCIGISSMGIMFAVCTIVYYRYEEKLRIWLYSKRLCLRWITENELDKNKIYDAFISYSHVDNDFVVNNIVSKLENGPRPFKLCVHYRDWPAGEWIPNQVVNSVKNSKRTIVVLSENFLKSEWGKMEFRAAHCQALKDGRARIIVIIYGDIPATKDLDEELQSYLQMNTYVKWGDPWFWEKLQYILPHANYIKSKRENSVEKFFPLAHISDVKL